jgi:hypothetical protein
MQMLAQWGMPVLLCHFCCGVVMLLQAAGTPQGSCMDTYWVMAVIF